MKIPEGRLRIIAGDVGGSFGMKSAVFNEAPLVLAGKTVAIVEALTDITARKEAEAEK